MIKHSSNIVIRSCKTLQIVKQFLQHSFLPNSSLFFLFIHYRFQAIQQGRSSAKHEEDMNMQYEPGQVNKCIYSDQGLNF